MKHAGCQGARQTRPIRPSGPEEVEGMLRRFAWVLVLVGWGALVSVANAGTGVPLVIWHSQPAKPGQTVLVYGDGLSTAEVHGHRLQDRPAGQPGMGGNEADGDRVEGMRLIPMQPRDRALKVVLPAGDAPGVFSLHVASGDRHQTVLVNAPQPWWARGAERLEATVGDDIRIFGLGLGWDGVREPLAGSPPGSPKTRVILVGTDSVEIPVLASDLYSVRASVPRDLKPGDYAVWVHNGCGGPRAWEMPGGVACGSSGSMARA